MKHNIKITLILIAMFVVTQLIGLLVIHAYTPNIEQISVNGTIQNVTTNPLPYGLETPEEANYDCNNFQSCFFQLLPIVIAFTIAILVIIFLTKFKASTILRLWFFFVVALVIAISIYAFEILVPFEIPYTIALIIPLAISIPLALIKIFKPNHVIHNFTELLIYPGIAAVFVPILGLWSVIILLILISIYDMWAVWHSGIMQKMATYQMQELKVFGGFFVPYMSKQQRSKLNKLREENKNSKSKKPKTVNIKINLAILGGGDVVFPIITAGVILRLWGLLPALSVILFGTLALLWLFLFSKKGKFYPAMPYISSGLFIGILVGYLIRNVSFFG